MKIKIIIIIFFILFTYNITNVSADVIVFQENFNTGTKGNFTTCINSPIFEVTDRGYSFKKTYSYPYSKCTFNLNSTIDNYNYTIFVNTTFASGTSKHAPFITAYGSGGNYNKLECNTYSSLCTVYYSSGDHENVGFSVLNGWNKFTLGLSNGYTTFYYNDISMAQYSTSLISVSSIEVGGYADGSSPKMYIDDVNLTSVPPIITYIPPTPTNFTFNNSDNLELFWEAGIGNITDAYRLMINNNPEVVIYSPSYTIENLNYLDTVNLTIQSINQSTNNNTLLIENITFTSLKRMILKDYSTFWSSGFSGQDSPLLWTLCCTISNRQSYFELPIGLNYQGTYYIHYYVYDPNSAFPTISYLSNTTPFDVNNMTTPEILEQVLSWNDNVVGWKVMEVTNSGRFFQLNNEDHYLMGSNYKIYYSNESTINRPYVISDSLENVIYGKTIHANTNTSLSSVLVSLNESGTWFNTTSDADGNYTLKGFSTNKIITVNASKEGYIHNDFNITIPTPGIYLMNLYLFSSCLNNTICGLTYRPIFINNSFYDNGTLGFTPLNNSSVTAKNLSYSATNNSTSYGYYEIPVYEDGIYTLNASKSNFSTRGTYNTTVINNTSLQYLELDCIGDINLDAYVNVNDFALFALFYNSNTTMQNYFYLSDFDNNSKINMDDFVVFAHRYKRPCIGV